MFSTLRRLLGSPPAAPDRPLCDLRQARLGPVEAYYEHGGKPCLMQVELAQCRWYGASGLSYSRDSLHPYIRTLIDYQAGSCTAYEDSFLRHYWQQWRPQSLAEYFRIDRDRCHHLLVQTPPNHNILPWSPADRIEYMTHRRWMDRSDYRELCLAGGVPARSCGPKPDWFGRDRFEHLVAVHDSIKTSGYRPPPAAAAYGDRHIVANCLLRGGEVRFLVADGQHRAAALAALGQRMAPVIVHLDTDRGPAMLRREEAADWPLVVRGIFSLSQAEAIFDRIFDAVAPQALQALQRPVAGAACKGAA